MEYTLIKEKRETTSVVTKVCQGLLTRTGHSQTQISDLKRKKTYQNSHHYKSKNKNKNKKN